MMREQSLQSFLSKWRKEISLMQVSSTSKLFILFALVLF